MQHTSRDIIAVLDAKKVPCGKAYTLDEVNEDENLKQRDMFKKVHHKEFGDIDVPGIPYKFSKTPGSVRAPAPGLGEHNSLILERWLGYSHDETAALQEDGIITHL